jgi:hypothetical protein
MCRFIGSSAPFLTPADALDVQVSQRVLPRIRGLMTRRQLDALDKLVQEVNASSECSFTETRPRLEELRDSASTRGWMVEDE